MYRILSMITMIGLGALLCGCGPMKSAIYLSVDGKEYSQAELFVDGTKIGKFQQQLVTKTGEFYLDGKLTGKDPTSLLVKDKDSYSGAMMYFSVEPGKHQFMLISDNGNKIEFEKTVQPGENYVTLHFEDGQVKWNSETVDSLSAGEREAKE